MAVTPSLGAILYLARNKAKVVSITMPIDIFDHKADALESKSLQISLRSQEVLTQVIARIGKSVCVFGME